MLTNKYDLFFIYNYVLKNKDLSLMSTLEGKISIGITKIMV